MTCNDTYYRKHAHPGWHICSKFEKRESASPSKSPVSATPVPVSAPPVEVSPLDVIDDKYDQWCQYEYGKEWNVDRVEGERLANRIISELTGARISYYTLINIKDETFKKIVDGCGDF